MSKHNQLPGFQIVRRDQLWQEQFHDAYRMQQKPAGPAVCPKCGVVFSDGHWHWGTAPSDANEVLCPACHRVQDSLPAGFVHLKGSFLATHRAEIQRLLIHREALEKAEHPMARIMGLEDEVGGLLVTTTDLHLARNLGEAVHDAYQGDLEFHYNKAENLLRVFWER